MYVVIDEVTKCKTSEKSKNPNQDYARVTVSDNTSRISGGVMFWPETYELYKKDLIEDSVVVLHGRTDQWGGRNQMVVYDMKVIG